MAFRGEEAAVSDERAAVKCLPADDCWQFTAGKALVANFRRHVTARTPWVPRVGAAVRVWFRRFRALKEYLGPPAVLPIRGNFLRRGRIKQFRYLKRVKREPRSEEFSSLETLIGRSEAESEKTQKVSLFLLVFVVFRTTSPQASRLTRLWPIGEGAQLRRMLNKGRVLF